MNRPFSYHINKLGCAAFQVAAPIMDLRQHTHHKGADKHECRANHQCIHRPCQSHAKASSAYLQPGFYGWSAIRQADFMLRRGRFVKKPTRTARARLKSLSNWSDSLCVNGCEPGTFRR